MDVLYFGWYLRRSNDLKGKRNGVTGSDYVYSCPTVFSFCVCSNFITVVVIAGCFFLLLFSGDTGFRARVIVSSRPNFSFYVRVRQSPPPNGTYGNHSVFRLSLFSVRGKQTVRKKSTSKGKTNGIVPKDHNNVSA